MIQKNDKGLPPGPEEAVSDEAFLERWSRRKTESARATEPAPMAPPEVTEPAGEAEKVLTDEDMPPLEELGDDSDYSGFLSEGVSEKLRQMALKKLFHSAKFNVCDGLDDYAEDYTKFEPLGDIVTADMKYEMKRAMEKALAAEAEADATVASGEAVPVEADATPEEAGTDSDDGSDLTTDDGEKDADDARLV